MGPSDRQQQIAIPTARMPARTAARTHQSTGDIFSLSWLWVAAIPVEAVLALGAEAFGSEGANLEAKTVQLKSSPSGRTSSSAEGSKTTLPWQAQREQSVPGLTKWRCPSGDSHQTCFPRVRNLPSLPGSNMAELSSIGGDSGAAVVVGTRLHSKGFPFGSASSCVAATTASEPLQPQALQSMPGGTRCFVSVAKSTHHTCSPVVMNCEN
mmetsp:Transcript_792/g.1785  ORF Transcript_792/g.1785 Transcript_792/m.1785 type:complete len:210 (-) Transcript_792:435-1064(-)